MKYACVINEYGSMNPEGNRVINIGDQIQLLAVMQLYKKLGIPEEDVVRIEYYDLFEYDGEELLLPINFIWFNPFWGERPLILSDKIRPIFLGIHCIGGEFTKDEIEYLRKYEPIGCRDEFTYDMLSNLGIRVYLHGCLTATFPRRHNKGNCIYFVDADESLIKNCPHKMEYKVLSHQIFSSGGCTHGETWEEYAQAVLNEYKENASLVVTSRLHCASPCMALGIPVIFAPTKYASTFSWIHRYIPIYDKDNWNNIDWSPTVVEFEKYKERLIEHDCELIENAFYNVPIKNEVENLLPSTPINYYPFRDLEMMWIEDFLKKVCSDTSVFKYALWGVTQITAKTYKYISDNYPRAELVAVYDNNRNIEICGMQTKDIKHYDCNGVYLIATGNSTSIAAKLLFEGKKWDSKFLCTCFEGKHQRG